MAGQAPGKSHRKGITLVELFQMFPDDAAAEAWFRQMRWPDGLRCAYCGSENIQDDCKHKTMPFRCRENTCGKKFSTRTGTVLQSSKLGYQKWALAIYILNTNIKGASSMKLHRDLGITQKSAWHLAHRIREAWNEAQGLFAGPVEADETFVGGLEKNRHASKRKRPGGGPAGKTPVVGMKDRASGKVKAQVIPDTRRTTLHGFVNSAAMPGAQLYTDDARAYGGVRNRHRVVRHSVGEYVNDMAHTNGIESFWALLKRGYHGTYHQMSPKHLNRYVTEFSGRHNIRQLDTIDQMEQTARGMVGKRLKYDDLIS